MNKEDFLKKYSINLTDKSGRINANLSRSKIYPEISPMVFKLTEHFHKDISFSDRLYCIVHDINEWPKCEICDNPVKLAAGGKFTPFCSFKCSRSKGSSTFSKAQQTCLTKYGVKSNLVTTEQLNLKRLSGGIGTAKLSTKIKIKNTNLERYGVENVFANTNIKNKIKETHDTKYGGNYHTVKLGKKIALLQDKEYCEDLAKNFCMSTVSDMLGVASNTIYKYFEMHNITNFNRQRSKQETEVFNFISSLGIKCISGDKKLINPYQIDVFIPEFNLGIEMNGVWWHSENKGCSPGYHLKKLKLALDKNIHLIQIFENEWALKQDIVKSRIKALLNKNDRIFARKCSIKDVDNTTKSKFLNENHLQGNCNSSTNLGLYLEDELVALMTFSKTRFDKSADFELIRFCNKLNCTVIGGFQKLLSHFMKVNNNPSLISFADRRWSLGKVYQTAGFKHISDSPPAYHYFKNSSLILENRMKFQKHKLEKILDTFDPLKSEWDNMKANKYNRIWDCGNSKWLL